jgi:hypothetical protein
MSTQLNWMPILGPAIRKKISTMSSGVFRTIIT